jgi:hypothetical protein
MEAVRMKTLNDLSPVKGKVLRKDVRFVANEAAQMCERRYWMPELYRPITDQKLVRQRKELQKTARALNAALSRQSSWQG